MTFYSPLFIGFFTCFFLAYWLLFNKNLRLQNMLVLAGSYFFYYFCSHFFVLFLAATSALNFLLGIYIQRTENLRKRRLLVWLGLLPGVGSLVFFKYFNFFVHSFSETFHFSIRTLNIIAPLGISFFTFRTISYLLDIDKGKIKATTDWVVFFNYVAFFPTILSGPIDKAKTFIPQLEKERIFIYENASNGLRQVLWGLFKKLVIADNCSIITDHIFSNYQHLPASSILIATILYTIQVYADFSGYSDIAIGIARLLGFQVTQNFSNPFFAQNIAEFWRKWHISLTVWVTEYIFIPLSVAFRDIGTTGLILATVLNFTILGIWHGANWTFVLFGFLHGCYFIPLIINNTVNKKQKIPADRYLPSIREALKMLETFVFVMLTFLIFRADTVSEAFSFYRKLFSLSIFSVPVLPESSSILPLTILIVLMLITEWLQRGKEFGLQIDNIKWRHLRMGIYFILIFTIILMRITVPNQFIYFKF